MEASNSRLKLNDERHEAFTVKLWQNNNKRMLELITRHESIIDKFCFPSPGVFIVDVLILSIFFFLSSQQS